jgi:hypothetical protein
MSSKARDKNCWAECLGGCSGGLSREHIVSEAFFEGESITVKGLDWTGDDEQQIGINSAVSKILCRAHNSNLSPLDAEIKTIRACFRKFSGLISKDDQTTEFLGTVDGIKFERWLLKTTINFIRSSPIKYLDFFPDPLLVEMAFGITPFNHKTGQGLYLVNPNLHGYMARVDNFVHVQPTILSVAERSALFGALVTFCGFPFFLNTIHPLTENLGELRVGEDINLIDKTLFHPQQIGALTRSGFLDHQSIAFSYVQGMACAK